MSDEFDPYHKWLGIPPKDQPPNHYRLLGLETFESDPDVIDAAAFRQTAHVRTYQLGPHSGLSQKLLNEIATAKVCLLDPQKKAAYDEELRNRLAVGPASKSTARSGQRPAPPLSHQSKHRSHRLSRRSRLSWLWAANSGSMRTGKGRFGRCMPLVERVHCCLWSCLPSSRQAPVRTR